ncbi:hypothetical protein ACSBR2_036097 [Camellia fascicularis]
MKILLSHYGQGRRWTSNEVLKRRQLWVSLVKLKYTFVSPWFVGGDFNEVRVMSERKGCLRRDRGMKDFNDLIDNLELLAIPMIGRTFTWCNALVGDRWNRIDRFLIDHRWLEKFSFK